jgi:hypothetical protein
MGYTNVKNGFQWHEHNIFGEWFYVEVESNDTIEIHNN